MNEEQIVELELERRGYIAVVAAYRKHHRDIGMDIKLSAFLSDMMAKAQACQDKIDDHFGRSHSQVDSYRHPGAPPTLMPLTWKAYESIGPVVINPRGIKNDK